MTKSDRNTIKKFLAVDEKLQADYCDIHNEYGKLCDQYDTLLLKVFRIIARIAVENVALANLLKACTKEMPGMTDKKGSLR